MKKQLIGLSLEELIEEFLLIGEKKFRALQLWNWIYAKGVLDFDQMWNFSKDLRKKLSEEYSLDLPIIEKKLDSSDGTIKWLIDFGNKQQAESVYIPDNKRGSLCMSSQVGCSLTCSFCHTGSQKWTKNLTSYDIVTQFMIAKYELNEWEKNSEDKELMNIVFMGMGEPLLNYDNVAKAIKILTDPSGLAVSKRRINLSTSGYIPNIYKCGKELGVGLAISLHAVNDELRNELVPLNKKFPIKDLIQACRDYPVTNNRITFEYVMLKNVNDSINDAKELVKLIRGIPALVNLIPFNPWPGSKYERSDMQQIHKFAEIIKKAGYPSPIRTPRGEDIMAACGQLKSMTNKNK